MDINEVLKPENIVLDLKAKNKSEVIDKLTGLLLKSGYLTDKESFVKDVMEREIAAPTGIGNEIAIPHGKSAFVKETSVAAARLETPIEWDESESQPVKFVILLAVNEDDRGSTHIKLLSMIARKLASEETCKKLTEAKTSEEILKIFSE